MRYIIGDLTVRLCSGVFHRIETIKQAAANYDYNPYLVTKPGMMIFQIIFIHKRVYSNFIIYKFQIHLWTNSLQLHWKNTKH